MFIFFPPTLFFLIVYNYLNFNSRTFLYTIWKILLFLIPFSSMGVVCYSFLVFIDSSFVNCFLHCILLFFHSLRSMHCDWKHTHITIHQPLGKLRKDLILNFSRRIAKVRIMNFVKNWGVLIVIEKGMLSRR